MRRLETERLILRDWETTDMDDAFVFWSNPNVTIPEGSLPIATIEESKSLVNYLIRAKNNYAVVLKETGRVVGSIGLNEDAKNDLNARNLGYLLAEEYWNQGLMTEALKEVIANAKEITGKLSVGYYNNPKSEHILSKLRFKRVDTIYNVKRKTDAEPA